MGFEEPEWVTSRSREVGERCAPGGWLGRARYDVGRFGAAREKEDGYPACVPFHCRNVVRKTYARARGESGRTGVYSAAIVVERGSERVGLACAHAAALVAGAGGGTIGSGDDAPRDAERGRAGGRHPAPRIRVERDLIVGVLVDSFYDVDLTSGGPIRTWSDIRSQGVEATGVLFLASPFVQNALQGMERVSGTPSSRDGGRMLTAMWHIQWACELRLE